MKISALIAQFPVSLSIRQNMDHILAVLEQAQPGDIVLYPEGSVSGYSRDLTFLDSIDHRDLETALKQLQLIAKQRRIYLWVGALVPVKESWLNRAHGFTSGGEIHTYDKINLAYHERNIITPGNKLPVFTLVTSPGPLKLGVQLCREIRYPEQWGWLARQGAQVILHLNHAIGDARQLPVWRSHLISRAAETQRFVLSANNAAPAQVSSTIAIAPNGEILGEIVSPEQGILRVELDLSQVSDWYLNQCREDVVVISPKD